MFLVVAPTLPQDTLLMSLRLPCVFCHSAFVYLKAYGEWRGSRHLLDQNPGGFEFFFLLIVALQFWHSSLNSIKGILLHRIFMVCDFIIFGKGFLGGWWLLHIHHYLAVFTFPFIKGLINPLYWSLHAKLRFCCWKGPKISSGPNNILFIYDT